MQTDSVNDDGACVIIIRRNSKLDAWSLNLAQHNERWMYNKRRELNDTWTWMSAFDAKVDKINMPTRIHLFDWKCAALEHCFENFFFFFAQTVSDQKGFYKSIQKNWLEESLFRNYFPKKTATSKMNSEIEFQHV